MNINQEILKNKAVEAGRIQNSKIRAFETMAGGIIHEFNNVLFPIIGYAEMLKEDLSDCRKQQAKADRILLAAFKAQELVQQMSTFVTGKASKPGAVKLYSMIKETLKLLRYSIPKTIEIQSEIDADCGMVNVDPFELYYAVINLVTCTCPAPMDTGCRMIISLKEVTVTLNDSNAKNLAPGRYACLSIKVKGPGVEVDIPVWISGTTREDENEPARNLSAVYNFARDYGGDLFITSELPMKKEIRLLLPIEKKPPTDALDCPGQAVGGPERILIIDDEKSVIRMQKTLLERLGYHVTARTDSREALILFRKNPFQFNLVISDMTMPDMTGDKLAVKLMKIRKDIPVILCTGHANEFAENIAFETGARALLHKPVQKDDFVKTIRKVIDGAQQAQA